MATEGRRYRILGVLGRGGFGTVYRAELLGEGRFVRQVALKVINAQHDGQAELARRMRDEARILGLLRHRAIVQVDGLVRLDDRWTVVMEYVDGVDLASFRPDSVPVGAALEMIGEVATGLHIAYTTPGPDEQPLRIVHRDIKPSNLLVTGAGEVKILDFGVARANFQSRESATGAMVFGSPGYIAPERMDYVDGPRGDVYSLGVVLAELLLGESFGKAAADPVRHGALLGEVAGRLRLRSVPEPVVALVLRMTAYLPDDRPSAREVESLCRDLRGTVGGPWLRDWAEGVVVERLRSRGLTGGHDFSTDMLSERTPSGAHSAASLHMVTTFNDESRTPAATTFPPPEPRDAEDSGVPGHARPAVQLRTVLWILLITSILVILAAVASILTTP